MSWTDATLSTNTNIKTVHITEIRNAINTLNNDSCPKDDSAVYSTKYTSNDATKNGAYYSSYDYGVDSSEYGTELGVHDGGYYSGHESVDYTNHCVGY